jgi:hypothetical protein
MKWGFIFFFCWRLFYYNISFFVFDNLIYFLRFVWIKIQNFVNYKTLLIVGRLFNSKIISNNFNESVFNFNFNFNLFCESLQLTFFFLFKNHLNLIICLYIFCKILNYYKSHLNCKIVKFQKTFWSKIWIKKWIHLEESERI